MNTCFQCGKRCETLPYGIEGEPGGFCSGRCVDDFHRVAKEEEELRDKFACAALTGLIIANLNSTMDQDVENSFVYADKMIESRGK